ncbi:MAG TPA: DUF72 domain-containing protein [Candidatus Acidoferrum sp.]|nr:DUF72 domain-containing protein [Candidatus Acidoferrum sp.]
MLRIGTSGYQYRHWRGLFYPRDVAVSRWLEYYVERFDTVELNSTFYRLPEAGAFKRWASLAPEGFTFAVKASRYLTHVLRLRDPRDPVERLMERAVHLDDHLGPILIQLPPTMEIELERLDETLAAFPRSVRIALEPRHPSWFVPGTRELLTKYGAALCLADRGSRHPAEWRTAPWTYLRFHQGRARPRPCYGRAALVAWIERLRSGWSQTPDAYVYFNNDQRGCAVLDAAILGRVAARLSVPTTKVPGTREAPIR